MSRELKRNINVKSKAGYNLNKQMTIPELKLWSRDLESKKK
jgi:hypothetical protein